ncbi:MAG: transcription antitermination factor NusB [Planctomycetota bacterium]
MRTARDLAGDLLAVHERTGQWVGERLEEERKRLRDPRDRALLTELVHGVVRQRGSLDAVLARVSKRPLKDLNRVVLTGLRLGAYQLLYLDRVPAHAVLDTTVAWASHHTGPRRAGYVNGALRGLLSRIDKPRVEAVRDARKDLPRPDGSAVRFRSRIFADPEQEWGLNRAQRWSHPRWLVERWEKSLGRERTDAVLAAGLSRPPVVVRARVDRAVLLERLAAEGIAARAGEGPDALVVEGSEGHLGAVIAEGLAAVQDATSQIVAPRVAPLAGESVLDLCAAPGGKALHLADLMRRGRLVAADVDEARLERVTALARTMGDVELVTTIVPPEGPLPFEERSFDRILVDAPCSNTGVLRRRVEARWRLRPEDITTLAGIQGRLLERAWPLLRPGGRLVYSTCSIEPEENEAIAAAFIAATPGARLADELRTFPSPDADGGYLAVIDRR